MSSRAMAGRVLLAVLLTAGAVGLVRQRREAAAVAQGFLPRASPDDDPVPTDPLGRAVSTWLPERPRTRAGRLAAAVWAAPASLIGLVIGTLGGGRPTWDPEFGCLVFEGTHGIPARLLRAVGAGANAIGQVVISTYEETSPRLLAHEALHVRQAERLGPALLPLYVLFGARYGYRHNPIERAAREASRRWTPTA